MNASDYIRIASEIEKIEYEFSFLDMSNSFERKRAQLLKLKLDWLIEEIKELDGIELPEKRRFTTIPQLKLIKDE